MRCPGNSRKSQFTCPGLVSVEKKEEEEEEEEGGVKWPISAGGPWESADWSFRERALCPAVKEKTFPRKQECVSESVRVCLSIFVRTGVGFGPWSLVFGLSG